MSVCDDKQTVPLPCLDSLFIRQKCGKVYLHRKEMWARKPQAHTKNCRCDAAKYDIVPQIKVNPSKATCFFSCSCFLWTVSLSHTQAQRPFVVWAACTHQILPPLPSPPPLSLQVYITGLTDSTGAESLPQLRRSALVCNTDLCAISHHWLHLHTAS